MREFKSLQSVEFADAFEAEVHGEDPIVEVKESRERIVISYTFPGFYSSDDSRDVDGEEVPFTQINIASAGFLTRSGRPLLPSFGRYVQIPFNCDYTVTVKKDNPVHFDEYLFTSPQISGRQY